MKELLCMFYPFKSDTRKQLNEKLICVSFVIGLFIYTASINTLIYQEVSYITIPLESAYIELDILPALKGGVLRRWLINLQPMVKVVQAH